MPNPAIRVPVDAHDELTRLADTLEITLGQAHRIALTAGLPELRRRATAYEAHVKRVASKRTTNDPAASSV